MTAGRDKQTNMGIYTTIVILAIIIAICYLCNLYASTRNWNKDKLLLKRGLNDIDSTLVEIKWIVGNIEKQQKNIHKNKEEKEK